MQREVCWAPFSQYDGSWNLEEREDWARFEGRTFAEGTPVLECQCPGGYRLQRSEGKGRREVGIRTTIVKKVTVHRAGGLHIRSHLGCRVRPFLFSRIKMQMYKVQHHYNLNYLSWFNFIFLWLRYTCNGHNFLAGLYLCLTRLNFPFPWFAFKMCHIAADWSQVNVLTCLRKHLNWRVVWLSQYF